MVSYQFILSDLPLTNAPREHHFRYIWTGLIVFSDYAHPFLLFCFCLPCFLPKGTYFSVLSHFSLSFISKFSSSSASFMKCLLPTAKCMILYADYNTYHILPGTLVLLVYLNTFCLTITMEGKDHQVLSLYTHYYHHNTFNIMYQQYVPTNSRYSLNIIVNKKINLGCISSFFFCSLLAWSFGSGMPWWHILISCVKVDIHYRIFHPKFLLLL